MITVKKRKAPFRQGGAIQYFVAKKTPDRTGWLYHDWFTLPEISEQFPECTVCAGTIKKRIKYNEQGLFNYGSFWKLITMSIGEDYISPPAPLKHDPKWELYINTLNLFNVRQYPGKELIMQSREY